MHSRRRIAGIALMAALLGVGQLAAPRRAPAAARAVEQCFAETPQCIAEPFLTYWQTHGGLAINGYPLTNVFAERLGDGNEYQVQYFERARFEAHPKNAAPYDVLLGQFGRTLYATDPNSPRATSAPQRPGAAYFDATGHNLEGKFRTYWETNGGLAQFGLPISEVFREKLEDSREYDVQYFERARFELHPDNAAPYDVLLGQFGRRIVGALSPNITLPYTISGGRSNLYRQDLGVRVRLGLPTANESQARGVIQPFERGAMIYREDTRTIYVIAKDGTSYQSQGNWLRFADTWAEGQTPGGGPAPVPDLFFPQRGFGKVWRDNPALQQSLGYALTDNETVKTLVMQPFVGGILIDVRNAPNNNDYRNSPGIYLLYNNTRFEFRYSSGP